MYELNASPDAEFFDSLKDRICDLFGKQYLDKLVRVQENTSYLSVNGFLGDPEFHKRTRGEQFLFVNDRYIKSRYLEHAVRTAYEDILPEGAFPFFILFLSIDPRHIDVNVHPTKAEVKFDDERGMYGFIKTIAKKALSTSLLAPQFSFDTEITPIDMPGPTWPPPQASPFNTQPPSGRAPSFPESRPFPGSASAPRHRGQLPLGDFTDRLYERAEGADEEGFVIPSDANVQPSLPESTKESSLLWQLHGKYILTQIRSGMMIIDQNAAHERVLFEKAMHSLESGFGLSQQLLFPHTLEFGPAEYELIKELMPSLRALGFEIDKFGGRSLIVRGVPAEIKVGDERTILEEILDQFKSNEDTLKIKARENLAKSLARKGAIRSGTSLDIKEMRSLVDQLFMCEKPQVCPYGRPTFLDISIEELDTRFGKH